MNIYFLGTGTAVPARNHSPAGLIIVANGQRILLDIGPGTLSRLYQAGITYDQIDHLFLTHLHPDHTLDLATLFQAFNYASEQPRTKPFSIIGCRGSDRFIHRMFKLFPDIDPLSFPLVIHQVFRSQFFINGLKIKIAPTGHTPESVAYRIEDSEHSLVYSGDASPHGELAQLAKNAELLISECSFPAGWETEDHLNADTVGIIAKQAQVKSLMVTHFYPPSLAVDLVGQIRNHYDGKIQMAFDGLQINL